MLAPNEASTAGGCRPKGSTTVTETKLVRVYTMPLRGGIRYTGCHRPTARKHTLGTNNRRGISSNRTGVRVRISRTLVTLTGEMTTVRKADGMCVTQDIVRRIRFTREVDVARRPAAVARAACSPAAAP